MLAQPTLNFSVPGKRSPSLGAAMISVRGQTHPVTTGALTFEQLLPAPRRAPRSQVFLPACPRVQLLLWFMPGGLILMGFWVPPGSFEGLQRRVWAGRTWLPKAYG